MSSQVYGQSVGLLNQLYVLSSQVYGQCVSGQPGVCSVQSVVWSVSDLVSQVYVLFSQVFGHPGVCLIQSGVWSFRCLVSQLHVLLEQVCGQSVDMLSVVHEVRCVCMD